MSLLVGGLWRPRRLCVVVTLLACAFATGGSALAAVPGPGWAIRSDAEPTGFSAADDAACATAPEATEGSVPCDQYRIVVTNAGSEPTSGPVTISDVLSSNVTAVFANVEEQQPGSKGEALACTTSPVSCTYASAIPPGGLLIVTINVSVAATSETTATSAVTVEGGGAATVSSADSTPLNASSPEAFGINHLSETAVGEDGAADTQAGDHPYAFTTSFNLNTVSHYTTTTHEYSHRPVQDLREIAVDLPPGFVGDPQAVVAQCPLYALDINTGVTDCPKDSEVGVLTITEADGGRFWTSNVREVALANAKTTPIYNMVPEAGHPAEFGFTYLGQPVLLYGGLVHAAGAAGGYVLQVRSPGLPNVAITSVSMTFFGDPSERDAEGGSPSAFFTNPTDCSAGPLRSRIEADSWEDPKDATSQEREEWPSGEATAYPQLTGCELLRFEPTIALVPETSTADTPSGYAVEVAVPQFQNAFPVVATPELKDATVTLPAGLSVSPSAASGLQGCSDVEIDLASTSSGSCPAQSKVGTVKIVTPLLAEPLEGEVFVGEPECSPCGEADAQDGRMLRLFVQAHGSGVLVKLEGRVSTSSGSGGRLTAHFENDPQLPFSKFTMTLNGGPWAPLANPQSCGTFTATSDLSPWSAPITPDATPSTGVQIGGCDSSQPFAPDFTAGSESAGAGMFTSFNLTFSRSDGEQDLSALQVTTPPGLLGMLSKVQLCPEPQAASGECGSQSLIGHSEAAAGAGPDPYWVGGEVFLTGPYDGAPFGLSVVTHAQAGPFNLGNVVVRAAIDVNPTTSAITVTSGPLPQILDGVPLRIKTVQVRIDREGFMFNPTNCSVHQISGDIASAQGTVVGVSSPFTVSGCDDLPFKPTLTAAAEGQGSKADGTRLSVKVTSAGLGQVDIAKVDLQLPKLLPTRLETLQKACLQAVFEADPADCDEGSVIGVATVHTPVLANPLAGPAYLVSHGGAEFPDVEFILQGEGVTLVLDGKTDIKHGITYSRFESVPDAPFTSFETVLPAGPHSVLSANVAESKDYDLCGERLQMPTTITAQNGDVIEQDTAIAIEGCGAVKSAKSKKLSRAQELANALKACRRRYKSDRVKRAACERGARKRHAAKKASTGRSAAAGRTTRS
jgi:hypothetical protein